MCNKILIITSIVGSILNFILGGIFYQLLFPNIYPKVEGQEPNLLFIFLGCLFTAIVYSLLITKWAKELDSKKAAMIGATFGFLNSLSMNFFMYSNREINIQNIVLDVIGGTIMSAIVCFVISILNKKYCDKLTCSK